MKLKVCLIAIGMALSIPVQAASIAINFSGTAGSSALTSSQVAGVGAVAQNNWNNMFISNVDGNGYGNSGTLSSAINNLGATVSGFSLNVTGVPSTQKAYNFDSASWGFTGDNLTLQSGMVYPQPQLQFAAIPYTTYDLYVYIGAGLNSGTGTVNVSGSGVITPLSTNYSFGWANGNFTQGNNYLLFSGLSSSDLVVNILGNGFDTGITGLQIVAVPEPKTFVLFGTGFFVIAMTAVRRRLRQN